MLEIDAQALEPAAATMQQGAERQVQQALQKGRRKSIMQAPNHKPRRLLLKLGYSSAAQVR